MRSNDEINIQSQSNLTNHNPVVLRRSRYKPKKLEKKPDVDVIDKEEFIRIQESNALRDLPLEIEVISTVPGYKSKDKLIRGIYRLGFKVRSNKEAVITYYNKILNNVTVGIEVVINRDINNVAREVNDLVKYMEENNIKAFNTERFINICGSWLRSGGDVKSLDNNL